MIEKIKKNIKYLNFLLIFFFTLILLLRPYQFVTFDSEPDYLANAIHILQWNIPWGGHHPGTIFQYFFAGVLKFSFFFNFSLETTILLLRFICLIFSLVILFISSKFYVRKDISFFNFIIVSVLIMPIIYWHISHFGIELILFSISFLIWSYFVRALNEQTSKIDIFIISIFIGIALSIKFSAVILLFIFFLLIFFNLKYSFLEKIIISNIALAVSLFTFVIITLPSARYYPKLFNKINREINIESLLSDIKFLTLFFISIILFFVIFLFKNKEIIKFSNKYTNEIYFKFFPTVFFVVILLNVIQNFNYDTYQKAGSFYYTMGLFRNFIPILPLFIIAAYKLNFRFNNFVIIIFTCSNIFLFYNFFYINNRIDSIVIKQIDQQILTFTTPKFNSKFVFLDYTKRRYGNGNIDFPINWPHNKNFRVIEHSMFANWLEERNSFYKKKKLKIKVDEKKKYLSKKRIIIKKLFKDKDYSEKKFDILSLERPFYKQRIIHKDYCEKITNKVIIFDKQNKFDLVNLNKFEKNINLIKKDCKLSNIKKNTLSDGYLKYFLER